MQLALIKDPELTRMIGQSTGPRTLGVLHLSQITKALSKSLEPDRFDDSKGFNFVKMEAGLCFEDILEMGLAERHGTMRVGEIVSPEGIWMSPDGFNPTTLRLEEFKCTWMTSRHGVADKYGMPLQKFQHWFWQIMGYCKWLDVCGATLRVFFVNGNYEHPYQPVLVEYQLDFSQEEINENWQMLVRYAREINLL